MDERDLSFAIHVYNIVYISLSGKLFVNKFEIRQDLFKEDEKS